MTDVHLREEVDIEALLDEVSVHDIYDLQTIPAEEADEQDWSDVIDEAYFLVGQVLDRKLPKTLRTDLQRLHDQLGRFMDTLVEH